MRIVALIPAHNEESSIAATVTALLAQERVPDHIVVIADNCTDATQAKAQMASRYEVAEDGFSVIRFDPRVSVVPTVGNVHKKSGAMNWAWRTYAQGADMVVTLDADTVLPPNAVKDWAEEFEADHRLGGSSSKFTMRGNKLLVRLQRYEFARWTDTGLRRGWTSVLAGTGCAIRGSVLADIAARNDREGPWAYTSQVEDFELTYRIRELGYHCHISPTVRAYTDAMDSVGALWAQRMKWQVGTVEDLLSFGVNRLTRTDWLQQLAGLAAAMVRGCWIGLTLLALLLHTYHFNALWLVPTVIFIANDTKQALLIPHRDRTDVLLAALLLPQEFFAWMRAAWFLSAWVEVLSAKVTGHRRDHWTLQYQAEAAERR